ncbi:gp27 [Streptococcus pneumoniae]|nr:gp27 [Streptococcus pneumoniae]
MVIYKADNAGAEIFDKVVEKGRHGKLYTLTIRDYGVFVVTKEQWDKVKVGDEVML